MFRFFGIGFATLIRLFCSQKSLLLENLALRVQLSVLKRRHPAEAQFVRQALLATRSGIPPKRLAEVQSGVSGVGVRGIQERLRSMRIESDGAGACVTVDIPVPNEVPSANVAGIQTAV